MPTTKTRNGKARSTRSKRPTKTLRPHTLMSTTSWLAIAGTFDLRDSELTVLQLVFDGHDEPGITRQLRRSRNTIHTHIKRLYEKLDVRNRTELLVRIIIEYLLLNKRKGVVRFRPGRVVVG